MTENRFDEPPLRRPRAKDCALETASRLFYQHGVRAIGMEEIVESSGIAKTTIYRHFPTKDALVSAFLEREDGEFWSQWDAVTATANSPIGALDALCDWIAERVARPLYRGCPQLNVAAEFSDHNHPARLVARRHKAETFARVRDICKAADATNPDISAMQITLIFDGAFQSDGRLLPFDIPALLKDAIRKTIGPAPAR